MHTDISVLCRLGSGTAASSSATVDSRCAALWAVSRLRTGYRQQTNKNSQQHRRQQQSAGWQEQEAAGQNHSVQVGSTTSSLCTAGCCSCCFGCCAGHCSLCWHCQQWWWHKWYSSVQHCGHTAAALYLASEIGDTSQSHPVVQCHSTAAT